MNKKLYLYTIFHANLQYSSIPGDHHSHLIDHCYWPLISLLDKYDISLGLEFPAYTLQKIHEIDETFLQALKAHRDKGRCEIIGSGYSQNIFPLIPSKANSKNLILGNSIYKELLDRSPAIAYINEQVYSAGLPKLYLEAGYQALILDWQNSVIAGSFSDDYFYKPLILRGADGTEIRLIWNSSISFQRFQRYVCGELSLEEYLDYLKSHLSQDEDRAFPLYASDWEILNPDLPLGTAGRSINPRLQRLDNLLAAIEASKEMITATPSDILRRFPPKNQIEIGGPEFPVTAKKQAKYNATRWAVCGRDNGRKNTQSYQAYHRLCLVEALSATLGREQAISPEQLSDYWLRLCYLWGSDFRSFTTEDKYLEFQNKMGFLIEELEGVKATLASRIEVIQDFALFNPHEETWENAAYEFDLHFEPGRYFGSLTVSLDNHPLVTQVENVRYYRDKSIRSARFVIYPTIPPLAAAQGSITAGIEKEQEQTWQSARESVSTSEVELELLSARGANIKKLAFPSISDRHLAGTISHDFYDEIGFSTDQYTAHTIVQDRELRKFTDLRPAEMAVPPAGEHYPIRVPIRSRVSIPNIDFYKTYLVYTNEPRLDIRYDFRISDLAPYFFRTGILTINPDAFDRETLRYSTVNGGETIEEFFLRGKRINQIDIIDARFSAGNCLGASEGWLDISDDKKGITVTANRSKLYSALLLHYEETRKSYYFRVYNSFCETDETTRQNWRGHSRFDLTYMGHKNKIEEIRKKSRMIGDGLVLITGQSQQSKIGPDSRALRQKTAEAFSLLDLPQ